MALHVYPKSFSKLLFVGFSLVALPLMFALVNNAISVDRLARQSQQAVYQAVKATHANRAMLELLTAMERIGRQFQVLGDPALLDSYRVAHDRFVATIAQFEGVPLGEDQRAVLAGLVAREAAIYSSLAAAGAGDAKAAQQEADRAAAALEDLAEVARAMMDHGNAMIDREVIALQELAGKAQRITIVQLLALIPVAVFLVGGFTVLITRPIRELDRGIRRLGEGDFASPVAVNGPEDLEYLGQQIDWLRRRLAELEEQKTRFLHHVSHELKTPLTALREGSDLLAEEAVGALTDAQREVVGILQENSIELRRRIEDLLNYSALRSRQAALAPGPVRMTEVLGAVTASQKLALRARDLVLETDCEDLVLQADAEKIRIIVDNLLSNAIKFTPRGGTIRIALHGDGGHAVMDLCDSGPGIAPEERDRVFEPFVQGRATGSGPVRGTGLGLAIVREYVQAHGGTVEIVDAPAGAHFRVVLPMGTEG